MDERRALSALKDHAARVSDANQACLKTRRAQHILLAFTLACLMVALQIGRSSTSGRRSPAVEHRTPLASSRSSAAEQHESTPTASLSRSPVSRENELRQHENELRLSHVSYSPQRAAFLNQTVALGRMEWTLSAPPSDVDVWHHTLRSVLSAPCARLGCSLSTPALRVALSAVYAPSSCNGRGRRDQLAGLCHCRAGTAGDMCEALRSQACNDDRLTCIGPHKHVHQLRAGVDAPNCVEHTLMASRCAGSCDDRQNRCVCGERARFPRRHMYKCEFDGVTRLMPWKRSGWDGFAVLKPWELWSTPNTTPPWFEAKLGRQALEKMWRSAPANMREYAWCDRPEGPAAAAHARKLRMPSCQCFENRAGSSCDRPVRSWCVNQCSGRGECASGFCYCHEGWTGVDCSVPIVSPAQLRRDPANRGSAGESAGLPWDGSGKGGGHVPLRPSVYVYELPPSFNAWLQESRVKVEDCMVRRYNHDNSTHWSNTAFGLEVAVHEMMLASPHRSHDPETADFFFVPVYGGCYISRFFRPTPAHNLFQRKVWLPGPVLGTRFYKAAMEWVKQRFPYWDRRGGADHIFAFPHDEGACVAPIEIAGAIKLTSWGRLEAPPRNATTIMPELSWHWPTFVPEMYASRHCYDPRTDILMPVYTAVSHLKRVVDSAAHRGNVRVHRRHWLLHWRGQVLHDLPNYSMGIRHEALALFGGRRAERVLVAAEHSRSYVNELLNSTFCAVLPGNGWGHIELPIMLGCIPVVVQDNILTPWEDVLAFDAYGLRVPRARLPSLVDIVRDVPAPRVKELQQGLSRVWERFSYSSLALAERRRRCVGLGAAGCKLPAAEQYLAHPSLTGEDAMDTLMQVLKAKLVQRGAS